MPEKPAPDFPPDTRKLEDVTAALARQFYEIYPRDYFQQITRLGIAALTDPLKSLSPLESEVVVPGDPNEEAHLKYHLPRESVDVAGVRRAAKILIANTYHHAAETLVRLYVAHRPGQGNPWLRLTRLTLPKFKPLAEEVSRWERAEREDADVRHVFLLADRPLSDQAQEALRFTVGWLRQAALECIEPYMYNAWKHGLGISQSATEVTLQAHEEQAGDPVLREKGDVVVNLARGPRGQDGSRSWVREKRFLRVRERIVFIREFQRCIDAILTVGEHRYVGESAHSASLPSFSPSDVKSLVRGGEERITKVSTGLGIKDSAVGDLELEHPIEIQIEIERPPSLESFARTRGIEPEDGTELSLGG